MALTAVLAAVTSDRVSFLVTHDGAAGDALVIPAADLVAAADGGGSNFLSGFFGTQWAGNNQANARRRLLGHGGLNELMDAVAHCRAFVRQQTGLIDCVTVDADVDGVDPLQNELNIATSAGVAGSFLLDVEYQHTAVR